MKLRPEQTQTRHTDARKHGWSDDEHRPKNDGYITASGLDKKLGLNSLILLVLLPS